MATTIKEMLRAVDCHLDGVGSRATAVPANARRRVKRLLDALRKNVAATRAAARAARTKRYEAVSEHLRAIQSSVVRQQEDRSKIVLHSIEADIASDQRSLPRAVEKERRSSDT